MKRSAMIIACLTLTVAVAGATEIVFQQVGYNYDPVASHPHQYQYELLITGVDPLQPVNDFHIEWPLYDPGSIIVQAPEGWVGEEQLGNQWQWGCWSDDEEYWVSEDGSLGGWEIQGQNPQLVGGYAKITYNGGDISNNVQVQIPMAPEPSTLLLVALGVLAMRRR